MTPFNSNQPKRELRITSRNFVDPNDTGEPDAYLSNADRAELGLPLDPTQSAASLVDSTPVKTEARIPNRFEMPRPRPMQVPKK